MISAAKVSIFHPNFENGRDNKLGPSLLAIIRGWTLDLCLKIILTVPRMIIPINNLN